MKIVYKTTEGYLAILTPSNETLENEDYEELISKDIPQDVTPYTVEDEDLPTNVMFRDAWTLSGKKKVNVVVDLDKSKEIAHKQRRQKRALELKQYDLEATVPSLAEQAEQQRQIIREKYDVIQTEIDEAEDIETLEKIVQELS